MNIVGKIASVLLAGGWLLALNGCGRWADDNEDQIEKRDSTAQSINGLRPEDQTPRYRPAPETSEALSEGGGASALQQKESADFQPAYDFKTWEDALVAYAHLVGIEYDQIMKEGLQREWHSDLQRRKPFALLLQAELRQGYLNSFTTKISTLS